MLIGKDFIRLPINKGVIPMKITALKIVHITSAHLHDDIRIFHKECVSLAKNNYDITLLHSGEITDVTIKEVKIIGINCKAKNRFSRFYKTVNEIALKAISLNADVYHLHDPELIRIIPKLKKKGAKIIFDAHENLPKQIATKHWIPALLKPLFAFLSIKIIKYYCKNADGIITVNDLLVQTYKKANPNTIAIHNYPLLQEFVNITDNTNKKTGAVYVGGLMTSRGITEVINAAEINKSKIVLAGKFESESYYNECKLLNGWQYIDYKNFLNRTEVAQVLSEASCGLLILHPFESYLESTPIKLFEYMAAGLPVIASDFDYWKKLLHNIDCVKWVNPHNVNEIATAINLFEEDKINAKKMGENGRKAVLEKYNWEAEEKILITFYKTLFN